MQIHSVYIVEFVASVNWLELRELSAIVRYPQKYSV